MINQPQQFFTLEMCQHLSSLAPEMEGHWKYVLLEGCPSCDSRLRDHYHVMCYSEVMELQNRPPSRHSFVPFIICPAWQVEDVMRNWKKIIEKCPLPEKELSNIEPGRGVGAEFIMQRLIIDPDTAYQKIEEYLWSIFRTD